MTSPPSPHLPVPTRCRLQAKLYPRLLAAMKPGSTLGLSHGFLLGVMKNDGVDFRKDINVVLVAPKVCRREGRGGQGAGGFGRFEASWMELDSAEVHVWVRALAMLVCFPSRYSPKRRCSRADLMPIPYHMITHAALHPLSSPAGHGPLRAPPL